MKSEAYQAGRNGKKLAKHGTLFRTKQEVADPIPDGQVLGISREYAQGAPHDRGKHSNRQPDNRGLDQR